MYRHNIHTKARCGQQISTQPSKLQRKVLVPDPWGWQWFWMRQKLQSVPRNSSHQRPGTRKAELNWIEISEPSGHLRTTPAVSCLMLFEDVWSTSDLGLFYVSGDCVSWETSRSNDRNVSCKSYPSPKTQDHFRDLVYAGTERLSRLFSNTMCCMPVETWPNVLKPTLVKTQKDIQKTIGSLFFELLSSSEGDL